jgi:hypothetical protein
VRRREDADISDFGSWQPSDCLLGGFIISHALADSFPLHALVRSTNLLERFFRLSRKRLFSDD